LSLEEIATRLDDRFTLLTQGSRTALPRQQTLRATIDWSYDLLSQKELVLFRRLAVFAGGWTLEEAETICSGDDLKVNEMLVLLTQLVDKSLVSMQTQNGETRYQMLETIRQYTWEKLRACAGAMPPFSCNWLSWLDRNFVGRISACGLYG
jgi:non-specific serine/threonine protein kinase